MDGFLGFSLTSPALLAVVLPLLVLIVLHLSDGRTPRTIALTGLEYLRQHAAITGRTRRRIAAGLWIVVVLLLGLLWAGPVFHSAAPLPLRGEETGHKEFLVAFDLSPSMSVPLAQTRQVTRAGPSSRQIVVKVEKAAGPTRFEAARETLVSFVDRLPGERIGLILFSTEPFLARWPTTDTSTRFREVLEENIGRGQRTQLQAFSSLTNLHLALDLARETFAKQPEVEGGAVILISDAEDDLENMAQAARQVRAAGIRLYTIGVGISQKITDALSQEFANDPGFRIFRVDSQEEMEEAYRLVTEVEESPLFAGDSGFRTELRWVLALVLGGIAALIFGVLEAVFHQSPIADPAIERTQRDRDARRFS